MKSQCLLCESQHLKSHYQSPKSDQFWACEDCHFVFREPLQWLSVEAEAERYLSHQNSVESIGYQNFLTPVVEMIQNRQKPTERGLDYGCGPQSVIQFLLQKNNYQMEIWDPQFHPDPMPKQHVYDYVSCTEVFEHFRDPLQEARKIKNLMNIQGTMYVKTSWVDRVSDFSKWHYQRDPTHVGFFGKKSFEYLSSKLDLEIVKLSEPCCIFRAKP
ncbi:MAG: methyltransferase domain-containing protein [Bdellovibrionales bacterium]